MLKQFALILLVLAQAVQGLHAFLPHHHLEQSALGVFHRSDLRAPFLSTAEDKDAWNLPAHHEHCFEALQAEPSRTNGEGQLEVLVPFCGCFDLAPVIQVQSQALCLGQAPRLSAVFLSSAMPLRAPPVLV